MKFFWFVMLAVFSIAGNAATESELLAKLPASLKGAVRGKVEQFKMSGLGASVPYRLEEGNGLLVVTVILFDGNRGPIAEELDSTAVHENFATAIRDVHAFEKRGVYRNVQELERRQLTLESGYQVLYASLSYESPRMARAGRSGAVTSYLVITGVEGYMLKIRASSFELPLVDRDYILGLVGEILEPLRD